MYHKVTGASEGWAWFACGWRMFARDPLLWIALLLIFFVIMIALSAVPLIGGLAVPLISPVLMAGLMFAAAESENGRAVDIGQLFTGFSDSSKLNPLLAVGAISLGANIAIMLVVLVSVGDPLISVMSAAAKGVQTVNPFLLVSGGAWITMLVGFLIALTLELLLMMGMVYAPALVMLENVEPIDAVKSSFMASLVNWLPLLIFSLVYLVFAVIATIPFLLGYIVLVPVTMCAVYCSYRGIYGVQQPSVAA